MIDGAVTFFSGTVLLRELFVVPATVAIASKGGNFLGIFIAGVAGMVVNDLWWFFVARFAPEKVLHFFRFRDDAVSEAEKLPPRANVFIGLLLASSIVFGARLMVFMQMVRKRVGFGSVLGSILAANIIWGTAIFSASWFLGTQFADLFMRYRPWAFVFGVMILLVFVARVVLLRKRRS